MKLTAETTIRDEADRLWHLTQEPQPHARWDLRFTDIRYLPKSDPDKPQRFGYVTKLAGRIKVEGWGETVAHLDGRGSRLRWCRLGGCGQGLWSPTPGTSGTRARA